MRPFIIIVVLVHFSTLNNLYAIDKSELDITHQNTMYSASYLQFQVYSPFLPHTSHLTGQKGFSVAYIYPGFYNGITGQVQFYYTASTEDSYHFDIGLFNFNFGLNKKLIDVYNHELYLNLNYGIHDGHGKKIIMLDNTHALIGLSDRIKSINKNLNIEITLDGFFHAGEYGDLQPFIPYTRGIVSNIYFSHKFFNKLVLCYGLGFGFLQYRYDSLYSEHSGDGYDYITHSEERRARNGDWYKEIKPRWDTHLIIPFGFVLSYKF